jgi:hypothetical protein
VGQRIRINGQQLAYPNQYRRNALKSGNCPGRPSGKAFKTWGTKVRLYTDARINSSVKTTLSRPTGVVVVCQKRGAMVNAAGFRNNWWSKLRDQQAWISNIYIDHPAYQLPGVPLC